ncbi:MAG: hypothetical protein H7Z16_08730 [Pyrinomonadaceae bacterium]|nr:hypothetical protein [Pyrinomonadaceae bacterium]
MEHMSEFRRLLEASVRVLPYIKDHERQLIDGEKAVVFLSPIVAKFLTSFDVSSAPLEMRSHLQRTAEALVVYGLLTHCLLFQGDSRRKADSHLDLEELYDAWLIQSLTATSTLGAYDKNNQGIPNVIFDAVFGEQVEPFQKELGIGWWRRIRNRSKFHNLFASGVCLGMMYDMRSKQLASP